ncbi:MAG TPA: VWA domain-containing protein [Gaiellaceae bacterium]|nr:VWA domain-containing protein [Gaiellaceae bacterium]
MSFGSPLVLLVLLVVPAAVAALWWLERGRERSAEAWAPAALLPNMVRRPPSWRRTVPTVLLLLGVALLLVGFARPKATVHVSTQEATLVVVLDTSGSMAAGDTRPTRFAVAKAIARRLAHELPHGYRISLVTFAAASAVVTPPTHDLTLYEQALRRAKTGPNGTALSDAVVHAVKVAQSVKGSRQGKRPPATIVVLSDGGQTAGRVTPQVAATNARNAHVPVNTVLVGTPDGIVQQKLEGGYTERIEVPAQAQTLQQMSRLSGGRFARGNTVDTNEILNELGSRVGQKTKKVEVTPAIAAGGLAFMLVGGLLSGVWFRRVP